MKLYLCVSIITAFFCFAKCGSAQNVVDNQPKDSVYVFKTPTFDGTGKFYLGREIAPVMGASGAAWLERDERQKEENTNLAIEKISMPLDGVIADIGAGTGYYTFKLAAKFAKGKVYAVDVQDEMIQYLNENKKKGNTNNVEIVKGNEKSPNLPDSSIDIALMVDVYHELEYPKEMLQSIRRSLKNKGKILLIEYRGEDENVPIKPLHKTTVKQLNKEMEASGFKLFYEGEFLPIQHFLVYEKQ